MKVAVITYQDRGSYTVETVPDEDKILSELLDELSIDYQFEIWSNPSVNWTMYDVLLLKSPWDYFDYYQDFRHWCARIQELGIPVLNDLSLVLWNSSKEYLLAIQKQGFGVIPTKVISTGALEEFQLWKASQSPSAEFVIKPAVSGGSKNTLRFTIQNIAQVQDQIETWLRDEAYLLQPFVSEIAQEGEYSYIFFDGKFSHAVLKKAMKGEFRVQHFFGGSVHSFEPSKEDLDQITPYVEQFAAGTLYARVDGIWREGQFLLMELELIEPYLFLYTQANARFNYKEALRVKLSAFS
jgi:hypothetical protein